VVEFFITIKEDAEEDLIEIFNYYEAQGNDLGAKFLESHENCLKKLKANPFHT
jgi:plasmid stabilization system protein ParE